MLAKPLELDGKEITFYGDDPETKGFFTTLATDDYLSLEGIHYQHEMRLTDVGRIPELHRPDARQFQDITLKLGSFRDN